MSFFHHFKVDGAERCGQLHARVTDARECEEDYHAADWEAGLVICSLCDGIGHGQPGYGPCPLEERGYWEARADEDREAAMGILPWHVARDLAEAR